MWNILIIQRRTFISAAMPQIHCDLAFSVKTVQISGIVGIKEITGSCSIIESCRTGKSTRTFCCNKFYIFIMSAPEILLFRNHIYNLVFFIIPFFFQIFKQCSWIICKIQHFPVFKHDPILFCLSMPGRKSSHHMHGQLGYHPVRIISCTFHQAFIPDLLFYGIQIHSIPLFFK